VSAVRMPGPDGRVRLLDPMTRQPYVPCNPGSEPCGPVEVRKATPEELARFSRPEPPTPRVLPVRGMLTDAEVQERRRRGGAVSAALHSPCRHISDLAVVAALRGSGGNVTVASETLGVSLSTMHRRVAAMRAGGRIPDTIPTPREAMYAARRPRGSVA
jgi:hypothetical protein